MKLLGMLKNKTNLAGFLIIIGLIIKIFTIPTIHPLTFIIDIGVSSLLIGVGILIFLISFFSS